MREYGFLLTRIFPHQDRIRGSSHIDSYKNQSIDLQGKSMDWFLYDRDFRLYPNTGKHGTFYAVFELIVTKNLLLINLSSSLLYQDLSNHVKC